LKRYLFLHLSLLIYSLGSIAAKLAAREPLLSLPFFIYYGLVLLILLIYAVLWQQIIKTMPLSVAISHKSVIIIWGFIWGHLIFNEDITITMFIGMILIISGIFLMVQKNE
jgi:drug/metabolite transporter (DMT)-like permease